MSRSSRNIYIGSTFAVLAAIIWSGNFVIARRVINDIPPGTLAFYRWLTATVIIFPFAISSFKKEWPLVKKSGSYLFWTALTGITLFNTFVYIGGHHTTAINLALIGTTSSPIIAVVLARIFLKERVGWMKVIGSLFCIAGVLFILADGHPENLMSFRFTIGDGWVLLAALCFAIYNTLVRKKPIGISPANFLFVIFFIGTLLLLPYYLWERQHSAPVVWDTNLYLIILYLGLGTSVISFLLWNLAIGRLGSGRTALFGNLIPICSTLEAVYILEEKFTWVHGVSVLLVFAGILLANLGND